VAVLDLGEAAADGGVVDAEGFGEAAQGPAALDAEAEELAVGFAECQVWHKYIPLYISSFCAFFRLSD
jgi:hypothetical protein